MDEKLIASNANAIIFTSGKERKKSASDFSPDKAFGGIAGVQRKMYNGTKKSKI